MLKVFGRLRRLVDAAPVLGPVAQCAVCGADLVFRPGLKFWRGSVAICPDQRYRWHHVAFQKARAERHGPTLTEIFSPGGIAPGARGHDGGPPSTARITAPKNRSRKCRDATESKGSGSEGPRRAKANQGEGHRHRQRGKGGETSSDTIGCGCCSDTRWMPSVRESERSDAHDSRRKLPLFRPPWPN